MGLSIIIVNWNSSDFVQACIRSIRAQTLAVKNEVIVVDNASYDDCGGRLACDYPDVIFVQSKFNLGFGRANNLGALRAKGEVLLFLNPDTEVKDRAIDRLYEQFLKLDNPGAVGCRLLNSDGSLQKSCVQAFPTVLNQVLDADWLEKLFPKSDFWGAAALYKDRSEPSKVQVVSGACLMIQKDVYDRVGGFSPEYFMYAEDLDLCYKTKRIGLHNYYVGDAVIVHHGGGSTNRSVSNFSNVVMRESVFRFLRKSRGRLYSLCYRVGLSGAAVTRMALLLVLYPAWLARGKVGGWAAAVRKWFGILRWGLGFEGWIRKYDQPEQTTTNTTATN
jgi:GT2 family glycosyltransferase